MESRRMVVRKLLIPAFVSLLGSLVSVCGSSTIPQSGGSADDLATRVDDFSGKPRVIVISDIQNEPDDQMSSCAS